MASQVVLASFRPGSERRVRLQKHGGLADEGCPGWSPRMVIADPPDFPLPRWFHLLSAVFKPPFQPPLTKREVRKRGAP